MSLTVPFSDARTACVESIDGFVGAVDALGEYDLLAGSRCHGWTRLDVVVHVIAGWQEMLGGMVSVVDEAPTVDAASYWPAFAAEFSSDDPVPALMAQRRRTATYVRPADVVDHLHELAGAVRHGVLAGADRPCRWQGHVFTAGDYLAVWAVEDVVHQLDLRTDAPAPDAALRVARATVEALVGESLPGAWSDAEAVLVGTGRLPVPPDQAALASRLPALG